MTKPIIFCATLFLILATKVQAFLPLPQKSTLTPCRTRLYDSEKPDPRVGESLNLTAVPKELLSPTLSLQEKEPLTDESTTRHEQHHPKMPFKLHVNDKDLWYDEESGKFFEACAEQTIPLDVIFERSLDTVEDAILHARRIPYDKGWIQATTPAEEDTRPTVVVLGSGWASHALIKVADTYKMRLIVVSPTNHFVFTPMLASAAVGTVEYRSMTEAVRASNPMIENYIEGKAVDIDIQKRVLAVKLQELLKDTRPDTGEDNLLRDIHYDKLVVAVGCRVMTKIVPGAEEFCYKLKTCEDARKLRTAIGECLEFANRPGVAPDSDLSLAEATIRKLARKKRLTWVIIGGGPTGVELAGEISDFIKDTTKDRVGAYHKLKGDVKIILVEGGPCLVPPFEERLRDHAFTSLVNDGVDVRLNTFVKEVGDGYIKLQHKDGGDIETIETGFSVWAAGITPALFVETLLSKLPEEAKGQRGRVKVDKWLRCPTPTLESFGSILVMGDAAGFETGNGQVLPQTAQVAAQQGAFVARMLDRGYNLSVTPPVLMNKDDNNGQDQDESMKAWLIARGLEEAPGFKFLNLGILAYLGEGKALSQIQFGDVPIFSYAGSVAFMLWRSVYLVKQVATRNRILVLFDWMKCKIFGRDTTRL